MKTFQDLDEFARGYIVAAFFTNDGTEQDGGTLPGGETARLGGMDYRNTGRTEELAPLLAEETIAKIEADCAAFQQANAELLAKAGDNDQNGNDFWYTRNHHGVGYWDRGYPDDVADPLTDAAHKCGEVWIYTGDDGKIYLSYYHENHSQPIS